MSIQQLNQKLLILGLFISFQLNPVFAQKESLIKPVTLHCENSPLRAVLQEIADQTNIGLVFHDTLVDEKIVTCRLDSMPVENVLNQIANQVNIAYKILPVKSVVLFKKNSSISYIKGCVVDAANEEALPYANVVIKGTKNGTASNEEGIFEITNVPSDPCTLQVSYIGYNKNEVITDVQNHTDSIKVRMEQQPIKSEALTVLGDRPSSFEIANEPGRFRFTPHQMRFIPSANNSYLERTLQLLPGISGGYDKPSELSVFGGTPDQNLILFDGIPIYKPHHYYGFISAFHQRSVENVNIYKAGFPPQYGDRLSSVVELTGNTVPSNKFNFGICVDLFSANGFIEWPISQKIKYFFSFRRSHNNIVKGRVYRDIGIFVRDMSYSTLESKDYDYYMIPYSFYDITSKLTLNVSSNDRLFMTFYSGNDREDSEERSESYYYRNLCKWQNWGLSTNWSHNWNPKFQSKICIAYSHYLKQMEHESKYFNYLKEMNPILFTHWEKGLKDFIFKFDNNIISSIMRTGFGWEISQKVIEKDEYNYLDYHPSKLKTIMNTIYFQNKWLPCQFFNFSIGFRETDFKYFEPRVSSTLLFSDQLQLHGSWGHYHQFLHHIIDNEAWRTDQDGLWLLSDEKMKPGFAEHSILSLSCNAGNYTAAIEGYYKRYDNLAAFKPIGSDYSLNDFYNGFTFGSGKSSGLEIMLQKKSNKFSGWISYHLGKVENRFPDINDGYPFLADYNRTHELKIVNILSLGELKLSAVGVFASGRQYTPFHNLSMIRFINNVNKFYLHYGEKNSASLPFYQRIDLHISQQFEKLEFMNLELTISLLNVFDRRNWSSRSYDGVNFLKHTTLVMDYYDVAMLGFTPMINLNVSLK